MVLNAQFKSRKPLCILLSLFAIVCARKRTASEVLRDVLKANCYGWLDFLKRGLLRARVNCRCIWILIVQFKHVGPLISCCLAVNGYSHMHFSSKVMNSYHNSNESELHQWRLTELKLRFQINTDYIYWIQNFHVHNTLFRILPFFDFTPKYLNFSGACRVFLALNLGKDTISTVALKFHSALSLAKRIANRNCQKFAQ